MAGNHHCNPFGDPGTDHVPYGSPTKIMKKLYSNFGAFASFLPCLIKPLSPVRFLLIKENHRVGQGHFSDGYL